MRTQSRKKRTKSGDCPCSGLCVPVSASSHGGNIYRASEELGMHDSEIIDFSASINPLGISEKVKNVIKKEMQSLVNYPDPDAKLLRERLAEHHDIDPETIICGNGSTELIYLIPRALKPERVLIPAPTFSEYERACALSLELRVMSYELRKETDFEINPDEFMEVMSRSINATFRIQKPDLDSSQTFNMAFLCNPNNPTGRLLGRKEVLRIADAARNARCMLIVDEAFIDFHSGESVITHVQDNPYLIVLRSMTKFYALTGLRIGYGVFHPDIVSRIKEVKEPWTVNTFAQKAAAVALGDREYAEKTLSLIKIEKTFLENGFRKAGVEFLPSSVNYYLLKVPEHYEIVGRLRCKGILVRDCSNFMGLDGPFVRVAVKSRKHNGILIRELEDALSVVKSEGNGRCRGLIDQTPTYRMK